MANICVDCNSVTFIARVIFTAAEPLPVVADAHFGCQSGDIEDVESG